MPTASKLVAAILIGALGYIGAGQVIPHLPPETRVGLFQIISAFFGVIVGWRFLGPRVGGGVRVALGVGLTSAVALTLCCMIYFSGYEMVTRAMRMYYGADPFLALQDMMQIAISYFEYLGELDVWGFLSIGGLMSGLICEAVSRRWS